MIKWFDLGSNCWAEFVEIGHLGAILVGGVVVVVVVVGAGGRDHPLHFC